MPTVHLIPVLSRHKNALQQGRNLLAELLDVRLPDGWPEFPEAFASNTANAPEPSSWPSYFFVSQQDRAVVGNGGFAGVPVDGEVEIGYEIAPEFRNQGFATAAVASLLAIAFAHPEIKSVIAHTLAETNASNAVLVKSGFQYSGEFPNAEVGKIWRWRIARSYSR